MVVESQSVAGDGGGWEERDETKQVEVESGQTRTKHVNNPKWKVFTYEPNLCATRAG